MVTYSMSRLFWPSAWVLIQIQYLTRHSGESSLTACCSYLPTNS